MPFIFSLLSFPLLLHLILYATWMALWMQLSGCGSITPYCDGTVGVTLVTWAEPIACLRRWRSSRPSSEWSFDESQTRHLWHVLIPNVDSIFRHKLVLAHWIKSYFRRFVRLTVTDMSLWLSPMWQMFASRNMGIEWMGIYANGRAPLAAQSRGRLAHSFKVTCQGRAIPLGNVRKSSQWTTGIWRVFERWTRRR